MPSQFLQLCSVSLSTLQHFLSIDRTTCFTPQFLQFFFAYSSTLQFSFFNDQFRCFSLFASLIFSLLQCSTHPRVHCQYSNSPSEINLPTHIISAEIVRWVLSFQDCGESWVSELGGTGFQRAFFFSIHQRCLCTRSISGVVFAYFHLNAFSMLTSIPARVFQHSLALLVHSASQVGSYAHNIIIVHSYRCQGFSPFSFAWGGFVLIPVVLRASVGVSFA